MNKILIIAHAPFAQALRACAMHVFPDCAKQVLALDVPADEAFEQTFAAACKLVPAQGHDLLVLTDVFGATPSNVAQRLLQHCAARGVQVREVTGVNLPMLLRALCYAALPLQELEQYALTGGTQGMFAVDIATGAPVCTLSPAAVAPPNAQLNAPSDAAQDSA
ncbi:MAG: PTS fructose transporter subunit IIA [Brachymonas sp.]|nr:PTS fructose transporter subunit IIA [Brachymonas sp.]